MFDETWTVVPEKRNKKRARASTGGGSTRVSDSVVDMHLSEAHNYESLSTDDKLNLILSSITKINKLEDKIDRALSITNTLHDTRKDVSEHADRLTVLEYKSIDNEARARRNNLLFKGFQETRYEDCIKTIKSFLSDELNIQDRIAIDRAHRLGKFRHGNNRFIIVAFTYFTDTEYILSQCRQLQNKPYSVSRDFPHEIVQARKLLWPKYKDLRTRYAGHTQHKVNIVYPAKLIHNGTVVVDMFPQWDEFMRRSRVSFRELSDQLSGQRTSSDKPKQSRADPATRKRTAHVPRRDIESLSTQSGASSVDDNTSMDATTITSYVLPYVSRPDTPTQQTYQHSSTTRSTNLSPSVPNQTCTASDNNSEPESPSLISGHGNPYDATRNTPVRLAHPENPEPSHGNRNSTTETDGQPRHLSNTDTGSARATPTNNVKQTQ
ncbi:MAG: hypothetical protein ABW185_07145 [Sedimenticola sp.]